MLTKSYAFFHDLFTEIKSTSAERIKIKNIFNLKVKKQCISSFKVKT